MTWEIQTSTEFDRWLQKQSPKSVAQVLKRLVLVRDNGYLGDHKHLGDGLWELRWKNGRRVYFTRVGDFAISLLLGGLKNEQDKQIKKARLMLE